MSNPEYHPEKDLDVLDEETKKRFADRKNELQKFYTEIGYPSDKQEFLTVDEETLTLLSKAPEDVVKEARWRLSSQAAQDSLVQNALIWKEELGIVGKIQEWNEVMARVNQYLAQKDFTKALSLAEEYQKKIHELGAEWIKDILKFHNDSQYLKIIKDGLRHTEDDEKNIKLNHGSLSTSIKQWSPSESSAYESLPQWLQVAVDEITNKYELNQPFPKEIIKPILAGEPLLPNEERKNYIKAQEDHFIPEFKIVREVVDDTKEFFARFIIFSRTYDKKALYPAYTEIPIMKIINNLCLIKKFV